MHHFNIPHACVLLLATWLGQEVIASSTPRTHRQLKAATKRADLYRRDVRITKKFEAEVGYVEVENGWTGASTFASQVRVNSQKPILNLEEVEHHLQDVQCRDGTMKLSFVDTSSARDAYHASCEQKKGGGLVVTSHESCNDEGERKVYIVHDVSFADDGESLELSVTESLWQDAFDQFDISFGHTTDDHLFRRHADFSKVRRRRQNFNVDIPGDAPDNITTGTFDLSSELIDTVFPAESFLAGIQELVPIPQLPIEIGCKNCSTRGKLALNQGAIKIDLSQIDLIPDIFQGGDDGKEIGNLVTGGFIELVATGVGARIELFARPKASGAFEVALFPIPILGFAIPGIGQAGASFEPRIAADFDISGGFELTYGIDVTIPDNSNIRLELTNIANSGVNGFPGSTLTPLPFNVNITDVEILLGLAFKPTIPVGFDFLDKLKAEAFVTMNLPRLDARLSTNPGRDCGNSSNSTAPFGNRTTEMADNLLSLGALTLVEANVSLTVDVGVGLTIPLLPPPFGDVNLEANIFSTVFPLVTACVDAAKSFPSMSAIGAVNATALPCTTTVGSNSTVYVPAVYVPATKTHAQTTATHLASTPAAVMPVHTPATTYAVEASMPAYAPAPMPKASEASKMPAHTPEAMPPPSHVMTTTHIVEAAPMPPHAIQSMAASHMPAPAVESKSAMSHIVEAVPMPAHTPASMPVLATTHIIEIVSAPAHMPEAIPSIPSHSSNATSLPFIIPASIELVESTASTSAAVAAPRTTITVLPAAANATLIAPSGSGGLNSSVLAAQQTGPAVFTGAGAKAVEVVWWKKMGVVAVGVGFLVVL